MRVKGICWLRLVGVVAGLLAMVVSQAPAQQVFIWDKDNGKTFQDPETGSYVGCQHGIEQALTANGHGYQTGTSLPENLSIYDVIFVVLGWC